jgi:hypothetical protein
MYKFLAKNGQTLAFGLGVLITVIFLAMALPNIGLIDEDNPQNVNIFNFGIVGTIILIIIAAASMILFGVVQVASSFRTSWKGILGFVILLVVFFVAYSTANSDISQEVAAIRNAAGDAGVTGSNLKFIGGSITTLLILVIVAVGAFVISEVINFFK